MHDKIVAVDLNVPGKSIAIMGGRGIGDAYLDIESTDESFRDLEMLIRDVPGAAKPKNSSLGNNLRAYYNRLYFHLGNKYLLRSYKDVKRDKVEKNSHPAAKPSSEKPSELTPKEIDEGIQRLAKSEFLEKNFETSSLRLVHELQNINHGAIRGNDAKATAKNVALNPNSIVANFETLIKNAKQTIDIVSPYIYLTREEITFLKKWLSENPSRRLRIITNSISTNDHASTQAVIDRSLSGLIDSKTGLPVTDQIKIFEYGKIDDKRYNGEEWYGTLHSKFFVIDGKHAFLGSSNLDPRSRRLNSESGFILDSGPIAHELQEQIEQLEDDSYAWGSEDWKALRKKSGQARSESFFDKLIRVFRISSYF
jgi:putative cardiolipin synthase